MTKAAESRIARNAVRRERRRCLRAVAALRPTPIQASEGDEAWGYANGIDDAVKAIRHTRKAK